MVCYSTTVMVHSCAVCVTSDMAVSVCNAVLLEVVQLLPATAWTFMKRQQPSIAQICLCDVA